MKDKITQNVVDYENADGYKHHLLREQKIPLIDKIASQRYGLFKIEFKEVENYYTNQLLTEKEVNEVLYLKENNEWSSVFSQSIFSFEKELEHGKESIYKNAPLIRTIFVDSDESVFYLEDIEGGLYCSIDKIHWYTYLVPFKKRPYFGRLDKLVKFRIPNYK
jgi:hypothetical protein